jgi:type I restriction enzyme S subunit
MKRYSKYKDSNSEWIGEIPEHWECTRLVNLGTFTASGIDKKINEDEELVKIINFTDIYSNSSNLLDSKRAYMEVTAPSYKVEEHQVKKGDLLFLPSSETFEDLGLSALVDEDLPNTAFSYHVIRLQFDKPFDHRFKKYLANNYNLLNYFSSEGKGTTRKILNRDSFKNACVVVPPLPEQTQISTYLDNKTSLIDKLINNNKKLIKLLEEKRTALINKVITKGLDPNVKMKDSGIEWIGEIPEHWEVKRMKYLGDSLIGLTYSPKDVVNESEGVLVLRSSNIQNSKLSLKDNVYVNKEIPSKLRLQSGDILICARNGSRKLVGKNILIDERNVNNTFGAFMAVFRTENYNFVYYYFNSELFKSQSGLFSTSTINQLTNKILRNMYIAIPSSPNEQHEICEFLSQEVKEIDDLRKKVSMRNRFLLEYRQSLISNVVTGKIDIREENA